MAFTGIVLEPFDSEGPLIDEDDTVSTENCHDWVLLINCNSVDLIFKVLALAKGLTACVVEISLRAIRKTYRVYGDKSLCKGKTVL